MCYFAHGSGVNETVCLAKFKAVKSSMAMDAAQALGKCPSLEAHAIIGHI